MQIKINTEGRILSDAELAALSIPEMVAWLEAFDWDCRDDGWPDEVQRIFLDPGLPPYDEFDSRIRI